MNCQKLTWHQFDIAVDRLAELLNPVKGKKLIYGQPRGGMCLAVALSHRLQIPLTAVARGHDNLIWVDDIIDTGDTHTKARSTMPLNTIFAAWMGRHHNHGCYVAEILTTDDWLVFPWEDPEAAEMEYENYVNRR